ncbi:hypothetical protein [Nocardia sp. NPDC051463]|uniref:hypothetical protein n=1 Tax=Nocardia sp. NPDC051463 TaxID=3154845 RepID=UPI00344C2866
MMIKRLIAATMFTVAATGITAATAHGQPVAPGAEFEGVDSGVVYTAAVAPDRSSATVTLASGTFEVTPTTGVITVLAPDGSVVGWLPTAAQTVAGRQVQVTPQIDSTATSLTLAPVGAVAPEPGALQNIGDAGTTIAGIAIGCVVGALIGLIFLVVTAIPGCIVGAIVGGIIGANQ